MPILQTPNEFLKDFAAEISFSDKSVILQSMNFETGRVMGVLEDVLVMASRRGVEVEINFDWVSQRFIHDSLPIIPPLSKSKRKVANEVWEKDRLMVERLKAAGVKMHKTNIPHFPMNLIPFVGRNHIKMYGVDGRMVWIGGVNLFDVGFDNVDFLVKFTEKKIIETLLDQFKKINNNKAKNDYTVELGDEYSITVDVGKKFKSLIYKKTIDAINLSSKNIIIMSQFVPDGRLLSSLVSASKRGVGVEFITSSRNNDVFTKYPTKFTYLHLKRIVKKYPNFKIHHLNERVHAKVVLVDDKTALFGSHNYTYSGVVFGTEEIMMKTTNQDLVGQIKDFLKTS